jgi:hypothetical protein
MPRRAALPEGDDDDEDISPLDPIISNVQCAIRETAGLRHEEPQQPYNVAK